MNPTRTLFLSLTIAALFATPALAARANTAEVLVDGKVVWRTIITSRGNTPIEAVWPKLANHKRALKAGAPAPDPADAKTFALKGKITLRISHGARVLGQADLDHLVLMRDDATQTQWSIPVSEVRRAAKVAGIKSE